MPATLRCPRHRCRFRVALCLALLAGVLASAPLPARATLTLPAIFNNNAVFLRDTPIPVWGNAAPAEKITVTLSLLPSAPGTTPVSATTTADPDTGHWSVTLPAQPASHLPRTLTITGSATPAPLRLENILIGEVWLASGQSNMAWLVKDTTDARTTIDASANPNVRVYNLPRVIADAPLADAPGAWRVASPATTGWMSAVAYHFARKLHADLGVPVAVICASRGSTRIQSWIPLSVFNQNPAFADDRDQWRQDLTAWPQKKAGWEKKLDDWKSRAAAARSAGKPEPKRPQQPPGPGHYNQPAGYYNAMIAPVTKVPVRGFLWYQGEANARRAARYRETLPALITSWRETWGRGDLPFLIVQLAAYRAPGFAPDGLERAGLREAQALAVERLPATGLVVTLDVSGPESKEHPRDKRPVGERLARLAGSLAYGNDTLTVNGPTLAIATFDGPIARVTYQPGTAGGLRTTDNASPSAFLLAGPDHVFHPAEARIETETTILLTSPAVSAPIAVRYAFCNDPKVNLVNAAGLPAAPFRTDDWPLTATPDNQ